MTCKMECFPSPWDLFHISIWERDHKKCLERVGILQKHGKRLNEPSVTLAERFFSLPVESAGNSVRLAVGMRGDT